MLVIISTTWTASCASSFSLLSNLWTRSTTPAPRTKLPTSWYNSGSVQKPPSFRSCPPKHSASICSLRYTFGTPPVILGSGASKVPSVPYISMCGMVLLEISKLKFILASIPFFKSAITAKWVGVSTGILQPNRSLVYTVLSAKPFFAFAYTFLTDPKSFTNADK